jgi:hypothetical protein
VGVKRSFTLQPPGRLPPTQRLMVRRFGYGIANVKAWETPARDRFVEQGGRVAQVEAMSNDLQTLVQNGLNSWNGNEGIGKIMGFFQRNLSAARDRKDALGDISKTFKELKGVTLADLTSLTADRSLDWWWKHPLEKHKELRRSLDEAFDKQAAEANQKRIRNAEARIAQSREVRHRGIRRHR